MKEEQIVDMLLRSGTESDMMILGLINQQKREIEKLKAGVKMGKDKLINATAMEKRLREKMADRGTSEMDRLEIAAVLAALKKEQGVEREGEGE